MATVMYLLLPVLFIVAACILFINVTADPGFDPWDLDGEGEPPPPSKLDFLRTEPVIYTAGAVMIGSVFAFDYFRP